MMSFFCLVNRFDVEGGATVGGFKSVVKAIGGNGGNSVGGSDYLRGLLFLSLRL